MARHILTRADEVAYAENPVLLLPLVLDEVNDIRTACLIGEGKLASLPPGVKGDPESCVLALALSNGWKAEIEEAIRLQNFEPTINFNAMAAALRNLGYEAGVETGYNDFDEEVVIGITIEHTDVTQRFIEEFDAGGYPGLILSD